MTIKSKPYGQQPPASSELSLPRSAAYFAVWSESGAAGILPEPPGSSGPPASTRYLASSGSTEMPKGGGPLPKPPPPSPPPPPPPRANGPPDLQIHANALLFPPEFITAVKATIANLVQGLLGRAVDVKSDYSGATLRIGVWLDAEDPRAPAPKRQDIVRTIELRDDFRYGILVSVRLLKAVLGSRIPYTIRTPLGEAALFWKLEFSDLSPTVKRVEVSIDVNMSGGTTISHAYLTDTVTINPDTSYILSLDAEKRKPSSFEWPEGTSTVMELLLTKAFRQLLIPETMQKLVFYHKNLLLNPGSSLILQGDLSESPEPRLIFLTIDGPATLTTTVRPEEEDPFATLTVQGYYKAKVTDMNPDPKTSTWTGSGVSAISITPTGSDEFSIVSSFEVPKAAGTTWLRATLTLMEGSLTKSVSKDVAVVVSLYSPPPPPPPPRGPRGPLEP
jgi:hypothetical protein